MPRCGIAVHVQRTERRFPRICTRRCAAERGADGVARHPYQLTSHTTIGKL
jgi:hypothetical protein